VSVVTNRLLAAMNEHDLDAFVACFASDYRSEQPAHPDRAFRGSEQVRKNWTSVFGGVPDFRAELLACATADDDLEIGEWRWQGTYTDGSPFAMAGIIVLGIEKDRIAWARLYIEEVDGDGAGIDEMVRETYRRDG
jgi:ketosteroid isomerase-like protein